LTPNESGIFNNLVYLDDIHWSYLSGLFDGEGSIHLQKRKTKNGYTDWSLALTLCNTNVEVMEYIHKLFGGSLRCDKRFRGRKDIYRWSAWGYRADYIIRRLHKYLIIKKKQAVVAMCFKDTFVGRGKKLTQDVIAERDRLHRIMSQLNRRGEIASA